MPIKKISSSCFRCFTSLELELSGFNNFFHGANGSGKTSILEALYFCSTGRSFKSTNKNLCIKENKEAFQISATTTNNNRIRILKKSSRAISYEIDQKKVTAIDLFRALPSTLLDNKTFSMFADTPKYRRKILDRCLMAADKNYSKNFFSFHRSLKQRNAALKLNENHGVEMWSELLVSSGILISDKREEFFQHTRQIFFSFSGSFSDERVLSIIDSIEIVLHKGWPEDLKLKEAIDKTLHSDLKRKTTSLGPHKADVRFSINNADIKHTLSRGEQKFMSILWCLSMHKALSQFYSTDPFLIIDDIHSELDDGFYDELIKFLPKTSNQLFFSDINNPFNSKINNQFKELKKFHVEQFIDAKKTK